jgi:hypothetical protein
MLAGEKMKAIFQELPHCYLVLLWQRGEEL